jgi:hypothetical protein
MIKGRQDCGWDDGSSKWDDGSSKWDVMGVEVRMEG